MSGPRQILPKKAKFYGGFGKILLCSAEIRLNSQILLKTDDTIFTKQQQNVQNFGEMSETSGNLSR